MNGKKTYTEEQVRYIEPTLAMNKDLLDLLKKHFSEKTVNTIQYRNQEALNVLRGENVR